MSKVGGKTPPLCRKFIFMEGWGSIKRSKRRENPIFGGIILVVFGLLILASNITDYTNQMRLRHNGFEAAATVTELCTIRRSPLIQRGSWAVGGRVFVRYEINGVVHNNRLNIQFRHAYVGEELRIYYNPSNPSQITPVDRSRATDSPVRFIPPFALSASIIIWGIKCIRMPKQKQSHSKRTK